MYVYCNFYCSPAKKNGSDLPHFLGWRRHCSRQVHGVHRAHRFLKLCFNKLGLIITNLAQSLSEEIVGRLHSNKHSSILFWKIISIHWWSLEIVDQFQTLTGLTSSPKLLRKYSHTASNFTGLLTLCLPNFCILISLSVGSSFYQHYHSQNLQWPHPYNGSFMVNKIFNFPHSPYCLAPFALPIIPSFSQLFKICLDGLSLNWFSSHLTFR